jgi:hypothetical protein
MSAPAKAPTAARSVGAAAAGRPLQRRRDLLVGAGHRLGPVPGVPVRVRDRVGHLRQHVVYRSVPRGRSVKKNFNYS